MVRPTHFLLADVALRGASASMGNHSTRFPCGYAPDGRQIGVNVENWIPSTRMTTSRSKVAMQISLSVTEASCGPVSTIGAEEDVAQDDVSLHSIFDPNLTKSELKNINYLKQFKSDALLRHAPSYPTVESMKIKTNCHHVTLCG